jgi:F0F1-type ATP synthase assembly protein I
VEVFSVLGCTVCEVEQCDGTVGYGDEQLLFFISVSGVIAVSAIFGGKIAFFLKNNFITFFHNWQANDNFPPNFFVENIYFIDDNIGLLLEILIFLIKYRPFEQFKPDFTIERSV